MIAVESYHLRPSATVLRLRQEFPDFLICELHQECGRPCFVATSARTGANGRPELIVRDGAEELRAALSVLDTEASGTVRGGEQA